MFKIQKIKKILIKNVNVSVGHTTWDSDVYVIDFRSKLGKLTKLTQM